MLIIDKLVALGKVFKDVINEDFSSEATQNLQVAMRLAYSKNAWFDETSQKEAILAWSKALNKDALTSFIEPYKSVTEQKQVLLICAGNIPFVALHDLICVLLSGHKAILKLSSDDEVLMRWLIGYLNLPDLIKIGDRGVSTADAVIATGSDNSNRYFEYYFGKKPHIFRANRTSVAVLDNTVTEEDLSKLGKDVFTHYGKGCRNVTHLFVQKDYDVKKVLKAWETFDGSLQLNKYQNNYNYNKSVFLINLEKFLDNGSVILKLAESLFSPLGVVHFSYYASNDDLEVKLAIHQNEIQCVVGNNYLPFGSAQSPKLTDYADGVDTVEFLVGL